MFSFELGWRYRAYIKTVKNSNFCEELPSKNDFEVGFGTFCSYDHSAKASEAVLHRKRAITGPW